VTPIQYQSPTRASVVGTLLRTFGRVRRGEKRSGCPPRPDRPEENHVTDEAQPLLVFFCSEQSGPARRMESLLAHLARKERTRLRIMRVDVEQQPELAARFRVAAVPTLVLVKGRRVVDRLEGRVSQPRIESMLEPHLPTAIAA
jgi:thioredoxin 1